MTTKFQSHDGVAEYLFSHERPPAWLVAAVPGAPAAQRSWQAANAAGVQARRDRRVSTVALAAFRATNPLAVDLEKAERAHQDTIDRLNEATRTSLAKLRAFDAKVTSTDVGNVQKVASTFALEQHARVEAAWAQLVEAADARDEAYRAAGAPGVPWTERAALGAKGDNADGGKRYAFEVLNAFVFGFPVDAVGEVRDGTAVALRPAPQEFESLNASERRVMGFK
ncbi:hypothetical protein N1027_10690 [Herbiconiux sp. CPCC 205763]|uniref:Uncharacterized protein n=1 Tax=Herbiconiux aconitum TaxID=2970913 RepID=A0ABT2GQV1_9MICO|nr:hypothetical protein [Herbiconiux aconitum]MCS5718600.1 hypothetical protein [Herbiconiux aconitum]